ncbi:MAG: hypothetical protein FWD45_05405 [Coriobacteriia bacterium]|nr:hypothetical protein [Coriobacteriia bacterium]
MTTQPTITLLHLYADLLNLYGENGNIKVLAYSLRHAGFNVNVRYQSLADTLDLTDCDLLYIGCGTEDKQLLALNHLQQHRQQLKDYLDKNRLILSTGNSADLFGQRILIDQSSGQQVEALGLFDYQAVRLVEREVGEVLFRFGDEYLIGFQNRGSRIECYDQRAVPMFMIEKGFDAGFAGGQTVGEQPHDEGARFEGFRIGGFIASSVLGLVTRNPAFVAWLADLLYKKMLESGIGLPMVGDEPYEVTVKSTTSAYVALGLQLDVVAFRVFLANHHSILHS